MWVQNDDDPLFTIVLSFNSIYRFLAFLTFVGLCLVGGFRMVAASFGFVF